MPPTLQSTTIGLMGFGAFGSMIAAYLNRHFPIVVHDPAAQQIDVEMSPRVRAGSVAQVGGCEIVVLAVPVHAMADAIAALRPHVKPGSIVIDVGSVKVLPAKLMAEGLPDGVDIIGTHPLFGPQSGRNGIANRKIAICPVRGRAAPRVAAFLRHALRLRVHVTTPEQHDRDAALVQGLTHLIAKVMVGLEPFPVELTTASFDLLVQAVDMVRHDSPGVYLAIEQANPFAAEVRERFFALADEVRAQLDSGQHRSPEELLRSLRHPATNDALHSSKLSDAAESLSRQ